MWCASNLSVFPPSGGYVIKPVVCTLLVFTVLSFHILGGVMLYACVCVVQVDPSRLPAAGGPAVSCCVLCRRFAGACATLLATIDCGLRCHFHFHAFPCVSTSVCVCILQSVVVVIFCMGGERGGGVLHAPVCVNVWGPLAVPVSPRYYALCCYVASPRSCVGWDGSVVLHCKVF